MARKVLVADTISEKGIALLNEAEGIEVDFKPEIGAMEDKDEQEKVLAGIISEYSGLIVRSGAKVRPSVIEAGSGTLKAIGRAGVGVDNIDISAATAHGIVVMNTPSGNTISTAEHAFTLMMSLARHIPQAHRSVMEGRFVEGRKGYRGVELYNKTLAILGMGRIGGEFARRAIGFGMKVVAYDPFLAASAAKNMRVELCTTVDEAIVQADFITLHMPKTPETTHIINAERIAKMKPSVRIINCARGGLIDEAALLDALKNGKVAGAALDVYENEPPPSAEQYELLGLEEVCLTPHLGASTDEAQENVGIQIAVSIRDRLLHGTVLNALNMPNLDEETINEIGPYLELSEKLGKLACQVAPKQADSFSVNYIGKVAEADTTLITRSALKGYLEAGSGEGSANYLNATAIAEGHGIGVSENRPVKEHDFTDLIEVVIGCGEDSIAVSGSFFGNQARLVKIGDRNVEAIPEGHLLLLENTDAPGMVGAVGQVLGTAGINIASMSLSRNTVGGQAMSVLNLDSGVDDDILSQLEAVDGITRARVVKL